MINMRAGRWNYETAEITNMRNWMNENNASWRNENRSNVKECKRQECKKKNVKGAGEGKRMKNGQTGKTIVNYIVYCILRIMTRYVSYLRSNYLSLP